MSGPPRTHNIIVQCIKYIVNFTISSMVRTAEMSTHKGVKIPLKSAVFGQKLAPFGVKFHSKNMLKMMGFSVEKTYVFSSKICQKIIRKSRGFHPSEWLKTASKTSSKVLENPFEKTSKPLSKLFGKPLRNPLPVLSQGSGNLLETP